MKPAFTINLLRNRVPSLAVRRAYYVGLMLYLALAGLAIAWIVYKATAARVELLAKQETLAIRERAFLREKAKGATLERYAATLDAQAREYQATLQAAERLLVWRGQAVERLIGLAAPLPPGIELGEADVNAVSGTVSVSVYVPADRQPEPSASPANLMAAWGKVPALSPFNGRLTPRSGQSLRVDQESFVSLGFDGTRKQEP